MPILPSNTSQTLINISSLAGLDLLKDFIYRSSAFSSIIVCAAFQCAGLRHGFAGYDWSVSSQILTRSIAILENRRGEKLVRENFEFQASRDPPVIVRVSVSD